MVKNKDDHHAGGISRRQTRIKTMTTTTEMSEDQTAKLAAKDPLPTWADEADERWNREQFTQREHRRFARILTGEEKLSTVRRLWKEYERQTLDSRRWHAWLQRNNAKYDTHRGCYLVTVATANAA